MMAKSKAIIKMMALVIATMMIAMYAVVPSFAAGQGSIVINNAVNGHTYTAYKIFAGTYDATSDKLSDLTWGNEITGTGKTALYGLYDLEGANQTAPKVAAALEAADDVITFADTIGNNVTGGTTGTFDSGTKKYTISDLEDGYYLIVDTYTPSSGETNVTYSRYMVQKVGNAEVNNKSTTPPVDKVIEVTPAAAGTPTAYAAEAAYADADVAAAEGFARNTNADDPDINGDHYWVKEGTAGSNAETVKSNTANIGDSQTYAISSVVPDMTGYKEYYMDFNDTLSKGLTYTPDSLTVTIGGTALAADAYTVTIGDYNASTGTSIKVHLKDLKSRNYAQDAPIVIRYSATVNDNAVIGNAGNPNTVDLDYSNKPSDSGNGTPDDNNDGVQGKTPSSEVNTFVTGIQLLKVDGADSTKTLAGAVFNVTASSINKVLVTGQEFVVDNDNGTYYLLTDGKYTDKAPTEATKDQYAELESGTLNATKKYKLVDYATTSVEEEEDTSFQVVTGDNGIINLSGLKEGTYTFHEVQAPAGYNLLTSDITITISSNIDSVTGTTAFAWAAESDDTNVTMDNGVVKFTVENNGGQELPSTGGIGTTMFYLIGAILVIGAGVLLVTRRRVDQAE